MLLKQLTSLGVVWGGAGRPGGADGGGPKGNGESAKPPDVLRGQRDPEWGCGCGCDRNWASRTRCRECSRTAPRSILDKALTNFKNVVRQYCYLYRKLADGPFKQAGPLIGDESPSTIISNYRH